jgi:hypothetical protein
VTPSPALQRRDARKRAGALAARLRADTLRLADAREVSAGSREQLNATIGQIDRALEFGLRFDFTPDAELGFRRGHARNVALVLRRTAGLALVPTLDPAARGRCLRRTAELAEELIATVGWIQRRVREVEAGEPAGEWSSTWSGRLLALAARMLPAAQRREFVEDHCANLDQVESRREWLWYLAGLLTQMPEIASAAVAAGNNASTHMDRGGFPT